MSPFRVAPAERDTVLEQAEKQHRGYRLGALSNATGEGGYAAAVAEGRVRSVS